MKIRGSRRASEDDWRSLQGVEPLAFFEREGEDVLLGSESER